MFTEVLRIKPVLDESTAKNMETSLSSRFARVAGRFGSGLKSVIKGSVLGISLALLSKILNPIEALDEKMKSLLGHGTDVSDLAERFGTSSGKVKQIQDVAQSFGVAPDQLKEVMSKFADAIEKAREEMSNPFEEKSASTAIVAQFAKEKDIAESFKKFLVFLKQTGSGPGTDQPLTLHAQRVVAEAAIKGKTITDEQRKDLLKSGELRRRTGPESEAEFQKQVLGAQQFGGVRKLINSDFDQQANKIKEPSIEELSKRVNKLSDLSSEKSVIDIQNQTKDFMQATQKINSDMVKSMAAAEARDAKETTDRLASYENLKMGADAVADIQQGFSILLDNITFGLGELKKVTEFIPRLAASPLFKGILNTFSKRE